MSWATLDGNQIPSWIDLQTSPFVLIGTDPNTLKCPTKDEVLLGYDLDSSFLNGYAGNQLIKKSDFVAAGLPRSSSIFFSDACSDIETILWFDYLEEKYYTGEIGGSLVNASYIYNKGGSYPNVTYNICTITAGVFAINGYSNATCVGARYPEEVNSVQYPCHFSVYDTVFWFDYTDTKYYTSESGVELAEGVYSYAISRYDSDNMQMVPTAFTSGVRLNGTGELYYCPE